MREILFRGKTVNTNRWIYGYYSLNFGDSSPQIREKTDCCCIDVIPETVGQFTSLTDKNGKKIFEGDILKGKHGWHNWNTSFDNDEEVFLKQKIRGAYGKCVGKTEFFGDLYHYFRNYEVEYYAPKGGWRVRNGSCFHSLDKNYILNRELEVIGNIHDNPELMEAK